MYPTGFLHMQMHNESVQVTGHFRVMRGSFLLDRLQSEPTGSFFWWRWIVPDRSGASCALERGMTRGAGCQTRVGGSLYAFGIMWGPSKNPSPILLRSEYTREILWTVGQLTNPFTSRSDRFPCYSCTDHHLRYRGPTRTLPKDITSMLDQMIPVHRTRWLVVSSGIFSSQVTGDTGYRSRWHASGWEGVAHESAGKRSWRASAGTTLWYGI